MIQLLHASKHYGPRTAALDDVSFHVHKGEFCCLTGPSGAGKTTLLKLLYAAQQPSSGQVLVGGRNISKLRSSSIPFLRRNLGIVFQDFKLISSRSVFDNIALGLEVLSIPRERIERQVRQVMALVGIQAKERALPAELSGGEQQRVAVARALVIDPTILLADEPTGNLDPDYAAQIMELIHKANLRGTTVLLATHDRSLIESYPRRTLTLERGKLRLDSALRGAR
ncbi:MAG: cell division ATP-binding protein FtsE [Candidatus Alcyoniella australis]|nr:cell division ATP-binding protein FtsE [Candidatus Alcyoniella australis]